MNYSSGLETKSCQKENTTLSGTFTTSQRCQERPASPSLVPHQEHVNRALRQLEKRASHSLVPAQRLAAASQPQLGDILAQDAFVSDLNRK